MSYTHEETNKTVLTAYYNYLGDDSGIEEINEVYIKAKAWDKNHKSIKRNTSEKHMEDE